MKIIQADEFTNLGGQVVFWQVVGDYELKNKNIYLINNYRKKYYPLDNENVFDDFINLSTPPKDKGFKRKSKEKEVFNFVKEYGFLGFLNFIGNKQNYFEILDIEEKVVSVEKIDHILKESKRLKLLLEFYQKLKELKELQKEIVGDEGRIIPNEKKGDYYREDLYLELEEIKKEFQKLSRFDGSSNKTILLREGTKREWYPFKYFSNVISKEFKFYLNNLSFNLSFGKMNSDTPLSERFYPNIQLNSLLQALYVKFYLLVSEDKTGNIDFCDVCGAPFIKTHGSKIGHQKCIKRRSDYKAMGKWNK